MTKKQRAVIQAWKDNPARSGLEIARIVGVDRTYAAQILLKKKTDSLAALHRAQESGPDKRPGSIAKAAGVKLQCAEVLLKKEQFEKIGPPAELPTNATAKKLKVLSVWQRHPGHAPKQIAQESGMSYPYVVTVIREAKEIRRAQEMERVEQVERLTRRNGTAHGPLVELGEPVSITFPCRWTLGVVNTLEELESLAPTIVKGVDAISGVFMRLCDTIRKSELPDWKVRQYLGKHFLPPRVSEIMRVTRAPDDVYLKYSAGLFGFKAALKQCRSFHVTPTDELNRRKAKKTAQRLVELTGGLHGEVHVGCNVVTVK
jgi:hypothetical protein